MAHAQIDWGSVPDWLAAVGSLTALVFAFFAVRAAYQTNVQQGLQLKALEEDRAHAQASKVAVWCAEASGSLTSCRIRNASELPIYSVVVTVAIGDLDADLDAWWWRFRPLEPHVVPPGTVDIELDHAGLDDVELRSRHLPSAALYFRDAHGKWWRRNVKGRLEQLPIDPNYRERFDRAVRTQGNKWNRIPQESTATDAFEAFL